MTGPLNIIFEDFGIWLLGCKIKISCLYISQGHYFIRTLRLWSTDEYVTFFILSENPPLTRVIGDTYHTLRTWRQMLIQKQRTLNTLQFWNIVKMHHLVSLFSKCLEKYQSSSTLFDPLILAERHFLYKHTLINLKPTKSIFMTDMARGYTCLNENSKTVPWFSPMHKEENELCIIYTLIYGCYHGLEPCLLLLHST